MAGTRPAVFPPLFFAPSLLGSNFSQMIGDGLWLMKSCHEAFKMRTTNLKCQCVYQILCASILTSHRTSHLVINGDKDLSEIGLK